MEYDTTILIAMAYILFGLTVEEGKKPEKLSTNSKNQEDS
jgi:hypothetical protein